MLLASQSLGGSLNLEESIFVIYAQQALDSCKQMLAASLIEHSLMDEVTAKYTHC